VQQADVGVLMTNPELAFEGLSDSILECMALGLPVVCGDGGGDPELVVDGATGFIVPPGDSARVAGEFSVETMVSRMMGVYDEAILRARHRDG